MDEIIAWMSDPEIRRLTLMEESPQSISKAEELFERMNKEAIPFAICLNDDRLIGMLRLAQQMRNATFAITWEIKHTGAEDMAQRQQSLLWIVASTPQICTG